MEDRATRGTELLRAALARARQNCRSYFESPGRIPRFGSTVLMAVFTSALTYAAISGITPALIMWLSDADQFVQDLATDPINGALLFTLMLRLHEFGLTLAGFAALLVVTAKVLMPPRGLLRTAED
ncbi:hypothetical protein [Achromobacter aegrifaciens]|uniref:hypothetical protein n=1 Tax=Achromobacter aegrifaciens TaxID=1287736 RepID=UPI0028A699B2|nr:hypothetical protein [Achromobacter aegrifaciens]